MKKTKISLMLVSALLCFVITFVTSCEKQEIVTNQNNSASNKQIAVNEFRTVDIAEKFEYQDYDKYSVVLAKALKELALNDEISDFILNKTKEYKIGIVPLSEVLKNFPELENEIVKQIKSSNLKFENYSDFANEIKSYSDNFNPVISIPNFKVASAEFSPIISAGIEVKDNPAKGIDDCIWAFQINNNNVKEIIIDEKEAMNTKSPLFVISYNTDNEIEDLKAGKMICDDYKSIDYSSSTKDKIYNLRITKLQINYRYDRSNKSEVNMKMAIYSGNGQYTNVGNPKFIYDMHKNYIGDYKSISTVVVHAQAHWQGDEAYIFNTYERDWYASEKPLGSVYCSNAGGTISLYGKMKFSNEWYLYDPNSPLPITYFGNYSTPYNKEFTSYKTKITFRKYN